jgi:hypothetical protein
MIRAREVARRVIVWSLVAFYLVLAIAMVVTRGEFWVLIAWTGFPIVGALILNARRGNAIGRLLLGIGLYWPVYGMIGFPGVFLGVPIWVELFVYWFGYLVWVAVPLILIVFPTGRIETRLGRGITWGLAALAATLLVVGVVDPSPLEISGRQNPLGLAAAAPYAEFLFGDAAFAIVPLIVAAALVDLIRRWRRSTGVQRLQFRWLAYGSAITVATIILTFLMESLPDEAASVLILGLNAIPVAIGIAVTRHGLYEIGRVVSRTVSYAIVTALAIGVYALIVTSLTLLLPGAPAVGVALATLAAAALFLPALRGVQRWVDRRFDRERYVTEKVVDAFGERLRTGGDPATTAPDLMAAVERTLQPASVGIWMPEDAR